MIGRLFAGKSLHFLCIPELLTTFLVMLPEREFRILHTCTPKQRAMFAKPLTIKAKHLDQIAIREETEDKLVQSCVECVKLGLQAAGGITC